jgi:hypothetical protein
MRKPTTFYVWLLQAVQKSSLYLGAVAFLTLLLQGFLWITGVTPTLRLRSGPVFAILTVLVASVFLLSKLARNPKKRNRTLGYLGREFARTPLYLLLILLGISPALFIGALSLVHQWAPLSLANHGLVSEWLLALPPIGVLFVVFFLFYNARFANRSDARAVREEKRKELEASKSNDEREKTTQEAYRTISHLIEAHQTERAEDRREIALLRSKVAGLERASNLTLPQARDVIPEPHQLPPSLHSNHNVDDGEESANAT